jgi:hypothetical protein
MKTDLRIRLHKIYFNTIIDARRCKWIQWFRAVPVHLYNNNGHLAWRHIILWDQYPFKALNPVTYLIYFVILFYLSYYF